MKVINLASSVACGLVQVTVCKTLGFIPSINKNKVMT